MLITSNIDAPKRMQKLRNGGAFCKSLFLGEWDKPKTVDGTLPQAYLVDQDPNTVVETHYHQTEQWQVVVGGEGTLGRHAVRGVALHFTDPYTAYGPITPNPDCRIVYFTMRSRSDPGAVYLDAPGAKQAMRPSKRRFLLKTPDEVNVSTPDALRARSIVAQDALVPMHDDGVAAWVVRLGPNQSTLCPNPSVGGGQNIVVINGSLVREGKQLGYCSCAFVYPADAAFAAQAGPDGAELLVLQYPRAH